MKGVEFEEDLDIIKSPDNVRVSRPIFSSKNKAPSYRPSRKEVQIVVTFLVISAVLFLVAGILFYKAYDKMNYLGKVTSPDRLSQVELYQLPENIRVYIQVNK